MRLIGEPEPQKTGYKIDYEALYRKMIGMPLRSSIAPMAPMQPITRPTANLFRDLMPVEPMPEPARGSRLWYLDSEGTLYCEEE
jgi:hypothetical protein